jgi:hypothetical protein
MGGELHLKEVRKAEKALLIRDKSAFNILAFAIKTKSTPKGTFVIREKTISRISLVTRFLITARLSIFLETIKPKRELLGSFEGAKEIIK